VLANVATVSSTTADPLSNNNTSEADSTVAAPPPPTLAITKAGAPDPVTAGTNLTYTITASNNGTVDLDAAAIRDTLPASTTFVSITPAGGWSCSGTSTITCSAPGMTASSSATLTLVVAVDPATPAGPLTNQAFFDTTVSGRDQTVSTSVSTQVVVSADLSITKSDAPDPVATGGNITYTIGVTNAGPSNAASVTLSDTIPSATTFVSLVPAAGWSCSGTSTITCSIASMAPGSASFHLTVATGLSAAGTTVSNTATVSSSSDANTANNSATASTTVSLVPTTTTVSSSLTTVYLGQSVTFTANVTDGSYTPTGTVQFKLNGTPIGAPVTLAGGVGTFTTNTLPPGTYILSADYSGGGGFATSTGTGPTITAENITISQIPVLGGRELMMLAALLLLCGAGLLK
jgi:uncharacterized repeat protein (TIGR01451 family)